MATAKRTQQKYLSELEAARETVSVLLSAGEHTQHQALLDAVAIHNVSYRELATLVQEEVQS
jgi:hypothetical protein